MKENLRLGTAKILQKLITQKEINGSEFRDKKFLEELKEEKIVHIKQLSSKRVKIILLKNFEDYLLNKFNISNLDEFIEVLSKKDISRNELSHISNDTKIKATKVQGGIYINTLEEIQMKIDDEICLINPLTNGSIFINHLSKIELDEDILLVIVENFQNLLSLRKQKYLFSSLDKKLLFVFRNSYLYKYLAEFKNEILYFGDIDLAGVSIFLNDIRPKIKAKSSFFIPQNLELELKNANDVLYFKQYEQYKNLSSNEKYISDLIKLLHKYKKSIEQESFIL